MYLGGNRRWVPLSIKLVGSKFNRDRSLRRYESLSTRKKPRTRGKTGFTANFAIQHKLFAD